MKLPSELEKWSHLPNIHYKGKNEWGAAECPNCGMRDAQKGDRWCMWAGNNARGWCRSCGYMEFADRKDRVISSFERDLRALQARIALEEFNNQLDTKRKILEEKCIQYNLAVGDEELGLWSQALFGKWEPATEYVVDKYKLGFVSQYHVLGGREGSDDYVTPALSIPYWKSSGGLSTAQFRLINPPNIFDRYRFAPIPSAAFQAEPHSPRNGSCLLVEGAKKAIVTWLNIGSTGLVENVEALPSANPSKLVIEEVGGYSLYYLALDPDAYRPTRTTSPISDRVIEQLKKNGSEVRSVRLSCKPDDFFTIYNRTSKDFEPYLRSARRHI